MSSCERTEKRSEGDPISSILLPLIGRGGVIGLVLEHVIRFCSRLGTSFFGVTLRSCTSLVAFRSSCPFVVSF